MKTKISLGAVFLVVTALASPGFAQNAEIGKLRGSAPVGKVL